VWNFIEKIEVNTQACTWYQVSNVKIGHLDNKGIAIFFGQEFQCRNSNALRCECARGALMKTAPL
jgi:hypothetical protein